MIPTLPKPPVLREPAPAQPDTAALKPGTAAYIRARKAFLAATPNQAVANVLRRSDAIAGKPYYEGTVPSTVARKRLATAKRAKAARKIARKIARRNH